MNIAIIIPTFNRSDKLETCLRNLIAFRTLSSHNIEIIICNNCSTDGTEYLLNEMARENLFIKYYTRNKFEKSGHESAVKLIDEVSEKYDWYWLFGDDDLIDIKDMKKFDQTMLNSEIDYIYAPTYYKKINDNPILDKIKGLADYFGLIDLFGFFSSQIFSKKAILKIKNNIRTVNYDFDFCFVVPVILYQSIPELNGYIGTDPWVRNINDTPSDGSAEPWFSTENYLNLANSKSIIKFPKNKEFFLSEKRFIWRNFMCWIIAHSVANRTIQNLHLKEIISKTIALCDDENLIKNEKLLLNISFELLDIIFSSKIILDEKIESALLQTINEIYQFINKEHRN